MKEKSLCEEANTQVFKDFKLFLYSEHNLKYEYFYLKVQWHKNLNSDIYIYLNF